MRFGLPLTLLLCLSASAAPLTDFMSSTGKYFWESKFFEKPAFKARVIALVGKENYQVLQMNIAVSGPVRMEPVQAIYFLSGVRAHMGGQEMSTIVYDRQRDALVVYIKTKKKIMIFEEERLMNPTKFPAELKEDIRSFYR